MRTENIKNKEELMDCNGSQYVVTVISGEAGDSGVDVICSVGTWLG
jgi:hypothetical protein